MQIRFQGLPVWALVIAGAAAIFLLWRYRGFLEAVGFPRPAVPLAIRASAFLLLIMLAAGPVIYLQVRRPAPRNIAFIIDSSQSMQLKDGMGRSRWERAEAGARRLAAALGAPVSVFTADEKATPLPALDSIPPVSPTGGETFLLNAADQVQASGEEPFSDIIVFTDGRDTSGAQPAGGGGERIFAVGFGNKGPDFNTGVSDVSAPEYGFVGEPLEIGGNIHTVGAPEGDKIGIELFDGDRRADHKTVVSKGVGEIRIPFKLKYMPKEPGMRALTVRAKMGGEEPVEEDSERTVFIEIVTERKSLLYVDSPRWESKFLSDYLSGVGKLNAAYILIGPKAVYAGAEFRSALGSEAGLSKYKLLVIGAAAPYLTEKERSALAGYVKQGGQAIALGGSRSMFSAGGEWSAALGADELQPMGGDEEGFEVTPTSAGWSGDLLRLSGDPEENRRIWKSLPFIRTFNRCVERQGDIVQAAHPWIKCGGRNCPLVFIRRWGRGRLLALAFEGLWRWGFQEKDRDASIYGVFWKNVLDEMLEKEREVPLKLTLSARTITLGGRAAAVLRVSDKLLKGNIKPKLIVLSPSGGRIEKGMAPMEGREGFFRADFRPGLAGRYALSAELAGQRSDEEPMAVQVSPSEFRLTSRNDGFLEKLTRLNGGIYVAERDAGSLAGEINKNRTYQTVRIKKTPWGSPALLLMVVGLLSLEWIIRRRGGLA